MRLAVRTLRSLDRNQCLTLQLGCRGGRGKQTRDIEVRGGYLWSPKSNHNGARNQTNDNVLLAKVADTVYSYAHGRLGAIGVVIRAASP